MINNFWVKPARPFFCLAPMEDVTDTVFRRMVISFGRPDVFFTEFTNVDAIVHAASQAQKFVLDSRPLRRLDFTKEERPIVAQIWGTDPDKFRQAAEIIRLLGFDGIDINLGCPVRDIVKKGACSAMITDSSSQSLWLRKKVSDIIASARDGGGGLPISVKTRIGRDKIITEDWIGYLLEQEPAAITIHGRTTAEQSAVPAHWEEIGKAVQLKSKIKSKTKIIGNGDVKNREDGKQKAEEYGVDGVMIGRGALTNPWVFSGKEPTINERLEGLVRHSRMYVEIPKEAKSFAPMKKFIKAYINGFPGACEMRLSLMKVKNAAEMEILLNEYLGGKQI